MWAAVRQLTGRQQQPVTPDGIDADCLNKHYADISTDRAYVQPPVKLTAIHDWAFDRITEHRMFRILDSLKPTATGLSSDNRLELGHFGLRILFYFLNLFLIYFYFFLASAGRLRELFRALND